MHGPTDYQGLVKALANYVSPVDLRENPKDTDKQTCNSLDTKNDPSTTAEISKMANRHRTDRTAELFIFNPRCDRILAWTTSQ